MSTAGIDRELPTPESRELLALVTQVARDELAPAASEAESAGEFPRETFRMLGKLGLLGLPYDSELGGAQQPYVVYLQVIEELASAWLSIALGTSVHTLSCHPLATFGTVAQRERWLPEMVGGDLLGAYCLSEPHSGSDAAALSTAATQTEDGYSLTGTRRGSHTEALLTSTQSWHAPRRPVPRASAASWCQQIPRASVQVPRNAKWGCAPRAQHRSSSTT